MYTLAYTKQKKEDIRVLYNNIMYYTKVKPTLRVYLFRDKTFKWPVTQVDLRSFIFRFFRSFFFFFLLTNERKLTVQSTHTFG